MKKVYAFIFLIFGWIAAFSQPPVINVSPANLTDFLATYDYSNYIATSQAKSYTVSGTNLLGDINIYGDNTGYGAIWQASLTETPFVPANIHLTPVAGIVPPTTVYVRIRTNFLGNVFDVIDNYSNGAATKGVGVIGDIIMPEPTVPSTLSFGAKTNNSIVVNMNGGNGNERILFVKESSPVNIVPQDLQGFYHGNGVFGWSFTYAGNGNYAVYTGPAHSVTVTGLAPGKVYYFALYEVNVMAGPLYPPSPTNYDYSGWNYLLPGNTGVETTSGALPIIINYITGKKQNSSNLLNWKVTCISTPRATMILERSADSRNFTGITSITADAVRCSQPFDYTDTDPLKGMNYYRLKMTDADGKVSYSGIVALLNAVKGFDIVSITPNPVVSNNFKLNVASAQAGTMEINIFDIQGRLVNRQALALIAGFNSIPVNVGNLSSGTYTIRGKLSDDESKVIRFVKQ